MSLEGRITVEYENYFKKQVEYFWWLFHSFGLFASYFHMTANKFIFIKCVAEIIAIQLQFGSQGQEIFSQQAIVPV